MWLRFFTIFRGHFRKRRGGNKDEESTCRGSTSAVVKPAGVYAVTEHVYQGLITDEKTTKEENKYDNGDICKNDKADRFVQY